MTKQFKIKDWLNDFLAQRGLNKPDGRHLFSYHTTPDEFFSLEEGLRKNAELSTQLGCQTPFELWENAPFFNAVFVLYSSLCWQQKYDGTTWTYDFILNPLKISLANPTEELKDIITKGLKFWGLEKNDRGYAYLGAIAREAGLPQKLLSENRGALGRILHTILREALRSNQSGSIITSWVESCKTLLPQSCQHKDIITLLADSINAILDIKNGLQADTFDKAITELNEKSPGWRSRFPLPLYDETARDLLNRLLEDAASSMQKISSGSPISARRCLVRNAENGWKLQAYLDIPSKIDPCLGQDMPRVLSLRVASGQKAFEAVLKKHAENKFYFFQQKQSIIFSDRDAAQEILIQYTTSSGFRKSIACPGGMELDTELPWIFEGEQYDYRFRQQGGGSVRGNTVYVALSPGWEAEDAEYTGLLQNSDRRVYRMTKSGRLKKDDFVVSVRTSSLRGEEYDWSRDNRFWDVEMLQPSLAFCGSPHAIYSMDDTIRTPHGEILWKTQGMESYRPLPPSCTTAGTAQVWFKASSGASLRSRMLILPAEASVSLTAESNGHGRICLEHWNATYATFTQPQENIELVCHIRGDSLELTLKTLPECIPPASVELSVYWKENPQPARIRVPFPLKGARMFNAEEQEILPGIQICAFLLYGLRLYCFSMGVRHIALRLSASNGKSLSYPLESRENGIVIRLMDWQNAILEMLATESGLDAHVTLDILFDNRKVAGWRVARYDSCLIPEGTKAVLALPKYSTRPPQGYAMKALLLSCPEYGPIPLTEIMNGDETPSGRWEIAEYLDRPGPWLIFDDTEGTSLRPLLWNMNEGKDEKPINSLQAAIALEDSGSRLKAFSSCIASMERNLDAPEWPTLLDLLKHVKSLPLSTLEVWQGLIRSPRIMAILALHPGISFQHVISRISTELPFLWNFVSRKDWKTAGESIRKYFEKLIPGELSSTIWQDHMQKSMENLGSCYPSINALLHIALSLPCDEQTLTLLKNYYTADEVTKILFKNDSSEMQKTLRNHADELWPEDFTPLVNREKNCSDIQKFMSFSYGPKNGVLGLPILLTLQAFASQELFIDLHTDPNIIFHIRKHIHFDAEWFEQASTLTAYCCMAEHFAV
ncbi:MAG: STY4851/ECs_5259 family protein [Deltaproteobacteria bacterium]|nr:STY4851/ECs_5259 family protein [Deltaproteobacteria bacterium]